MIVMLLMLPLAAQDVQAPPEESEIVVIANKLKNWRASMRWKKGTGSCKTRQSSGDFEIDAIGCDSMLACWPRFLPRFEATTDKSLDKAVRAKMTQDANHDLGTCMIAERETRIAALADKRGAAQ